MLPTLKPDEQSVMAGTLQRPRLRLTTRERMAEVVLCGGFVLAEPSLNHRPEVDAGLHADDSAALLRDFFADRR